MQNTVTSSHHPALGPVLTLCCAENGVPRAAARLAVEKGFNLFSWAVDGCDYLYCDEQELAGTGFGGMPLLYPAPNRTRDATYWLEGRRYRFCKGGAPRDIHGLVYDEPWQVEDVRTGEEGCEVCGSIHFDAGGGLYEAFPFAHSLRVRYRLEARSLTMAFTAHSRCGQTFPLGLGVHSYFRFLDPEACLCVPAKEMFWSDAQHFPHRVVSVRRPGYDLREPVPVQRLRLDDVYTGLGGKSSAILYPGLGKKLSLYGSGVFQNAVVFTPAGLPYFCYENQTCMTNAFRAEEEGLQNRSGLIFLAPGERCAGHIRFSLSGLKALP